MKFLFYLLLYPGILAAQSPACNFAKLLQEGKSFARQREYKKALYKYNSARRCNPDKSQEVDVAIEALLDQVEGEKGAADIARAKSEVALAESKKQQEKNEKIIGAFYFYADRYGLAYKYNKYGFIDKNGNVLIQYQYSEASPFDDSGYARVKRKERFYLLDTLGNEYPLATEIDQLSPEILALDLRNRPMNSVDSKIFEQKQLKILLFSNNGLTYFPDSIGNLRNLQVLELSANHLDAFPVSIKDLQNLRVLNLVGNGLRYLPEEITRLSNLQVLDLALNELDTLPASLLQLKNLKYLNLQWNPIGGTIFQQIQAHLPNCIINWAPRLDVLLLDIYSLYRRDDYPVQDSLLRISIAELREIQDTAYLADQLGELSNVAIFNGHLTDAIAAAKESFSLTAKNWVKVNIGHSYLLAGQYEEAIRVYREIKDLPDDSQELPKRKLGEKIWEDFQELASAGIHHTDLLKAAALILGRELTNPERELLIKK